MRTLLRSRFLSRYGSIVVLLLLCAYYSVVTLTERNPVSESAGRELARAILASHGSHGSQVVVLAVVRATEQDRIFAQSIVQELAAVGGEVLPIVSGEPYQARETLHGIGLQGRRLDVIATNHAAAKWGPLRAKQLQTLAQRFPSLSGVRVLKPPAYLWPTFLTRENLLNVINQNADVAIIAIGMTLVIITAGINLSVGSVLALSGVTTAVTIQTLSGGAEASWVLLGTGGGGGETGRTASLRLAGNLLGPPSHLLSPPRLRRDSGNDDGGTRSSPHHRSWLPECQHRQGHRGNARSRED